MNAGLALLNMVRARIVSAKATQDAFFVAKTGAHAHKLVQPEPFKIPFGVTKVSISSTSLMNDKVQWNNRCFSWHL
jgi:hypothetical protein